MMNMKEDNISRLKEITNFEELILYFKDVLNWPFESTDADDIIFDYSFEDLGIDEKYFAKIESIKQLRPVYEYQPWGIFYVGFEQKSLPIGVLRRILKALIFTKRKSTDNIRLWNLNDLIFICFSGEGSERRIFFTHFSENIFKIPEMRVFSWDKQDTKLHFEMQTTLDLEKLRWPEDPEDVEGWKKTWTSAFSKRYKETITSSQELASKMAEFALSIKKKVIETYNFEDTKGLIHQLYDDFRNLLIKDLKEEDFADMYAQTIVYGLFSAKCTHEKFFKDDNISSIISNTNPFLRKIFDIFMGSEAGTPKLLDIDDLGISSLIEMLKNVNIEAILQDFGRQKKAEDPVIHFYELFLHEYNPEQKVKRGVFYTPDPVVSFIIRSIDILLKNELGFDEGLASISATEKINQSTQENNDFAIKVIDPATGTGTFLKHVILAIKGNLDVVWQEFTEAERKIKWNQYVNSYLFPRLFGYEIMMAPYAISQLKLELVLKETGYEFSSNERFNIALTNALDFNEEIKKKRDTLNAWLSEELIFAHKIKAEENISIVVGNPPYSRSSQNKHSSIEPLLNDYKNLVKNEPNIQALSDDYVKFIRLAQDIIERNGWGIVGMITNHTFLKGPIFRGMRSSLYDFFDSVYILDLHGNTKIQEDVPEGMANQNVFQGVGQGVCIFLFLKKFNGQNKEKMFFHCDLFGTQKQKYDWLDNHDLSNVSWEIQYRPYAPNYLFAIENIDPVVKQEYDSFISIENIFHFNNVGGKPGDDGLLVAFTREELIKNINNFMQDAKSKLDLGKLTEAKRNFLDIIDSFQIDEKNLLLYNYRPLDERWVYFDEDIWTRKVPETKRQSDGPNLIMLSSKLVKDREFNHVFITDKYTDVIFLSSTSSTNCYVFPVLYYDEKMESEWNLSEFYLKYLQVMGYPANQDDLESIIAYIYAILSSSTFRLKFNECLKNGAPKIPFIQEKEIFKKLLEKGKELLVLHLTHQCEENQDISCQFLGEGTNLVEKKKGSNRLFKGRYYINKFQYFYEISEEDIQYKIGKYPVLDNWLYCRIGRKLSEDDIFTFIEIIKIVKKSIKLIHEIDEILENVI